MNDPTAPSTAQRLTRLWPVGLTLLLLAYYLFVDNVLPPTPSNAPDYSPLTDTAYIFLFVLVSAAFTVVYLVTYVLGSRVFGLAGDSNDNASSAAEETDSDGLTCAITFAALIVFGILIGIWLTFFRPFAY